jgi:hypothetical protein
MQFSGYAVRYARHMAARLMPRSARIRHAHNRIQVSGDHTGGETPLPIPNREVKPAEADGTWGETPWESRKLPGLFKRDASDRVPLFICRPERGGFLLKGHFHASIPGKIPKAMSLRSCLFLSDVGRKTQEGRRAVVWVEGFYQC